MSHELRTPLNAIGGYADLLALGLGGPVTPQQMEYTDRIRRSQQHLMGIISDLLNYSRIEAGHITYELAPIAVSRIIDTVITLVEPQALAKGVAIERGSSPVEGAAIGDPSKVDQIMLNLLSNAIKFTQAGGRIRIVTGFTKEAVSISIADSGCGIPVDKHEAIFEPFVQLGRSLSSAHEGTGLGLAISRDLARAMNGDLTVISAKGAGSTFTLTLPRSV
jgi:signal transduction histidine kinase